MSTEAGETAEITKIFCCYADADRTLWREFEEHLAPLEHVGQITKWHEGDIQPGTQWEQERDKLLADANIILLFLSSSFLSSGFCYRLMQQSLEISRTKKFPVIPILLRPVYLEELLISELEPLPSNKKPVTLWDNRDEAFLNIVQGISKAINAPPTPEREGSDDFSVFFDALFRKKRY